MIGVCWQDWRDIREEIAVGMNIACHDVGLRKQRLGYHKIWVCWPLILLLCFWVLHCVDFGSAY